MKVLKIIREEEIFSEVSQYEVDESWEARIAVKMIVFDEDNKIALVGTRGFLLPGDGVESGESLKEAVTRECLEEVGCNIEVGENVGVIKDFRLEKKRKQEIHCFVARVVGKKGEPQTTQEDEQGMKVEWFSLGDALDLLRFQKETISLLIYHTQFNMRAHIVFLEEYIK